MMRGPGEARAAARPARSVTTWTFDAGGAAPPVVPVPAEAQPSPAGSVCRPRSTGFLAGGVAAGGVAAPGGARSEHGDGGRHREGGRHE
ncbi:hypothetical protein [Microbispora sp. GKU 823]|uniref:hypothetical protein n=1 Tax=Microbispora sp. GKU 823 TaxID=1652100 RepID=UPI0021176EC9|nr:hypothetical protein [Microbispora sp. GKU 823]